LPLQVAGSGLTLVGSVLQARTSEKNMRLQLDHDRQLADDERQPAEAAACMASERAALLELADLLTMIEEAGPGKRPAAGTVARVRRLAVQINESGLLELAKPMANYRDPRYMELIGHLLRRRT
jgi:hypothetical protein